MQKDVIEACIIDLDAIRLGLYEPFINQPRFQNAS